MHPHSQALWQRDRCGGRKTPLGGSQDELGPPDARVRRHTPESHCQEPLTLGMHPHSQSGQQRHRCGGRQAPLRGAQDQLGPPEARVRRRTPFSPLSIAADTPIAPSTLRFVRISLAHLAQSPLLTPPNLPWPPRAITLACLAQSPWLVSLSISLGRLDLPCSPGQSPLTASLDHACSRSITLGPLAQSHSALSISLGHLDLPCLPRSPLPASL